ncbi:MAG: ATP-dependent RNA helicase DeaD [Dinoroseobacter sp.]|jgi:ATP-dependent RNA helicase DeaD
MSANPEITHFNQLNLPDSLMKAVEEVGYETPSPIQCQTIPLLMEGKDVLGHAPTGTGKTAAFALPLLSRLDMKAQHVQIMVLTPTRELTIQVAEAFQRYASHMKGFHVLPVYGGQAYGGQISQLRRGVQVVVGTPGRVMDHMRKGTLKLDQLQALVLDEADEMLRMGFIDDVEWILEQTPEQRQIALFSATMPKEVERIARRHLNDPQEISIKSKTATAPTIRQRYWPVSHGRKLDALTRILETEHYEAMIMFVRTKSATVELAEKLEARGHAAAAINGDMQQKQREQTIERLKKGSLDILVATDVAARGLDVERISHVVNYDIPYDAEAYIHRIGRTGRAGRTGDAILFVTPREKRMLDAIERATRQKIELLELPTTEMVNNKRLADFKQKVTDTISAGDLEFFEQLFEQYRQDHDFTDIQITAALAKMLAGKDSLLLKENTGKNSQSKPAAFDEKQDRPPRRSRDRAESGERPEGKNRSEKSERSGKRMSKSKAKPPEGMERYRIEVGHDHEVKPGNIVGAIANEAGLDAKNIGHIDIYSGHSIVDLPAGMPRDVFRELKKVWVCGRQLHISHDTGEQAAGAPAGAPADAAPTARTPAREHRTNRAPTTGDQEAPERSDKKRSPPSRDKPVVKRKVRTADKKSKGKPVNKKPRPSS